MQNNYIAGKVMKMGGAMQFVLPKTRQLKKAFHNLVLTVICGFSTILVFKGTAGFGPYDPRERPAGLHEGDTGNAYSRSELQHARLIAEVNNIVYRHSQPQVQNDPIPNSAFSDTVSPSLDDRHVISTNPNPESLNDPLPANHPLNPTYHAHHISPNHDHGINPKHQSGNPTANSKHQLSTQVTQNPLQSTAYGSTDGVANTNTNIDSSKSLILLVTGSQPSACANPMGDHYLLKSLKNKMDYCRLHNIEIFYNVANFDPQMSGFWAKLPLLQRLMRAHPEKEWLWWMDSDAMITDMAFELPMDRYKDFNIILHGWKELVYEQKNWIGLNTGSFLIRNCQWSLDLIQAWAPMGPKGKVREDAGKLLSRALEGRPAFEADDQSALIYLLNEEKEKWASKVYLENAYYLHGYWLLIVDKYEEVMEKYHAGYGDERWPFVTHFVGCKPCGNKEEPTTGSKCLEQMERAFNFADNQVLQYYGFQHEALNTHTLVRSSSD